MRMNRRELEITAELARLELREEDVEKLGIEITRLLEYFEKMREIDVEGFEPTTHALLKKNRLRGDKIQTSSCNPEKILENAPETEDRFIIIPNVL